MRTRKRGNVVEGFEALLEFKDQMTGPIKGALGGLEKLSGGLDKLKTGSEKGQGGMVKLSAAMAVASTGAMLAVGFFKKITEGVQEFASTVFDATVKLLNFVIAAGAMNEKEEVGFSLLSRNAVEGERTYKMVDAIAKSLHIPPKKAFEYAKELMKEGVKPQLEMQRSLKTILALSKADEGMANNVKSIIERSSASRRLGGGRTWAGQFSISAEELGKLGVSFDDMAKAVELRGGKINSLMKSQFGQIYTSADKGIAALNDVMANKAKMAGSIMGGIPEFLEAMNASWQRFVKGISKTEGFKEFQHMLGQIVDTVDALGKRGGPATSILDKGFHLLAKGMGLALTGFLYLIKYTLQFIVFVLLLVTAFKQWLKQGDNLTILKGIFLGIALAMAAWLLVIGLVIAAFLLLWLVVMLPIIAVVAAFVLLGVAIMKVSKHFKTWKEEAKSAVAGLIDGLVSGMTKGIKAVTDAAKGLGHATLKGVKEALDMHSPSRKMQDLAKLARKSFTDEFNGGPGLAMNVSAQLPKGMGGGKTDNKFEWNGDLILGNIPPGMSKEEIKQLAEEGVADAFERIALEYGF